MGHVICVNWVYTHMYESCHAPSSSVGPDVSCSHTRTNTHTCTRTHTHTCTHTHTHTHTHTQTHTHHASRTTIMYMLCVTLPPAIHHHLSLSLSLPLPSVVLPPAMHHHRAHRSYLMCYVTPCHSSSPCTTLAV